MKALVLAVALLGGAGGLGPSGYAELDFSSTGYCVGDSWTLTVTSAVPTPIGLTGTLNGESWEKPGWAATDSSGKFSKTGIFTLTAVGKHTLHVYTDYWEFDTLSYEVLNCGVWGDTQSLNTSRANHKALLLHNGKVLVMGGNISGDSGDAELYDPATETWSMTGRLNTSRFGYTATLLPNGKVLVAGGYQNNGGNPLNSAELFDPETETWSATGNLNAGRSGHTATLLPNGQVLVGLVSVNFQGAYDWENDTELYNPETRTWRVTGSLLSGRSIDTRNQTVTVLPNGRVLLIGGIDHSEGYDAWTGAALYDPVTEAWRMTAGPNVPFGAHTATLLSDGKVFVAEETGAAVRAELYDPETEMWRPTAILDTPLNAHTATLLPNGKVLVVGTVSTALPPRMMSKVQIYDPETETWSASAPLKTARLGHTATLLPNGKVLVAAGMDPEGNHLASAELYDGGFDMPPVVPPVVPVPPAPKIEPIGFSIPDRGGVSMRSPGASGAIVMGYAAIQPVNGSTTPSGLAILGLRQNNVLVSEATVPASPLLHSGRIYAEVNGPVNTGVAIANPHDQPAIVSFYFTNSSGDFGHAGATIPAKSQIAAFLNQSPFHGPSSIDGTLSFNASVPLAVVALRVLTNERSEFLFTTMPVTDLNAPAAPEPIVFPHFADGGGWATELVLVNPTDSVLSGAIEFRDQAGDLATVVVKDQPIVLFPSALRWYSIPPRSAQKLQTGGGAASALVGSVRVFPAPNTPAPSGVAVFSVRNGEATVAEAGVPAVPMGSAFRLYVESSGDFGRSAAGSIQTALAITNYSAASATVSLDLSTLDSSPTGLTGTLSIPGNGQVALFLNQIPGLNSLPAEFQGILRVSSAATLSVIGLRGRYNERQEFLFTTTPPVNELAASSTVPLYFPHIVDSGGYTTQFILFGGQPGPISIGTIQGFSQSGEALDMAPL